MGLYSPESIGDTGNSYITLDLEQNKEQIIGGKSMAANFEVGDKVRFCRMDAHHKYYLLSLRQVFGDYGIIRCFSKIDKNVVAVSISPICEIYVPVEWLDLVEKGKKLYNGKVICTKFKPSKEYAIVKFTPGKVYTIKDGKLFDDAPPHCPYLDNLCSLDDIRARNYVDVDFIEFKGEA